MIYEEKNVKWIFWSESCIYASCHQYFFSSVPGQIRQDKRMRAYSVLSINKMQAQVNQENDWISQVDICWQLSFVNGMIQVFFFKLCKHASRKPFFNKSCWHHTAFPPNDFDGDLKHIEGTLLLWTCAFSLGETMEK